MLREAFELVGLRSEPYEFKGLLDDDEYDNWFDETLDTYEKRVLM